jgi:hypothetical protein
VDESHRVAEMKHGASRGERVPAARQSIKQRREFSWHDRYQVHSTVVL